MIKLCEIKSVGFGSGFVEDGLNCIAVDYRKFHFVFFYSVLIRPVWILPVLLIAYYSLESR